MSNIKRFIRSAPHPGEIWKLVIQTMLAKDASNKEAFARADAVVREYRERWHEDEWGNSQKASPAKEAK